MPHMRLWDPEQPAEWSSRGHDGRVAIGERLNRERAWYFLVKRARSSMFLSSNPLPAENSS